MLIVMDSNATEKQIREVHHKPGEALSDGTQSLYPEQFERLCDRVRMIYDTYQNGHSFQKARAVAG